MSPSKRYKIGSLKIEPELKIARTVVKDSQGHSKNEHTSERGAGERREKATKSA